jgi:hypothetical protein
MFHNHNDLHFVYIQGQMSVTVTVTCLTVTEMSLNILYRTVITSSLVLESVFCSLNFSQAVRCNLKYRTHDLGVKVRKLKITVFFYLKN